MPTGVYKRHPGQGYQKGHKVNAGKKNRLGFKTSEETKRKISIANSKPLVVLTCKYCVVKFEVWPSRAIRKPGFCSKKCYSTHLKENPPVYFRSKKGQIPWNKGKKMTKAYRDNISGERSPNWKGGVTPIYKKIRKSQEYTLWRTAVFERDKYACRDCGERGGRLNADHIKPFSLFPGLRFDINNGKTLCEPCHRKTDTWGFKIKNYKLETV